MSFRLRAATAADRPAVARLFEELETGDAPPDEAAFARIVLQTTVAEAEGGAVVGYLVVDAVAPVGGVRQIVSDPARRRSGVGRALMAAAAAQIRAAGGVRWKLNVKPGNLAARRLYESLGFVVQQARRILSLEVATLAKAAAPAGAEALVVDDVAVDEDAGFAAAIGVAPELLAPWRGRPSTRMRGVRVAASGAPVGWMAMDLAFPIVRALWVSAPAADAAVYAALRAAAADVGEKPLRIVVISPALEPLASALGARLHDELLEMEGPLPAE